MNCRYTAHGSILYSACDRGVVRRYRRYSDHHGYLGEVFRHTADIQDMDISPYDECKFRFNIWAASREKVPNVLSRCHTNRRAGAATLARPSFGMTTTQNIRDLFT